MNGPTCPVCSQIVRWTEVSFGPPFDCPHCEAELRVARSYNFTVTLIAFVASCLSAYALNMRDLAFIITAFIVLFPIGIAIAWVAKLLFPPRLHTTDRVKLDLRDLRGKR